MRSNTILACSLGLLLFTVSANAKADAAVGVSFHGGWSLTTGGLAEIKGASPNFGMEVTFGVHDFIQVGPYYDRNILYFNTGATGFIDNYGLSFRAEVARVKGLMFDFRLGTSKTKDGFGKLSNNAFAFGAAIGYRLKETKNLTVKPRIGFKSNPYVIDDTSIDHFMIDMGLMLSILF